MLQSAWIQRALLRREKKRALAGPIPLEEVKTNGLVSGRTLTLVRCHWKPCYLEILP